MLLNTRQDSNSNKWENNEGPLEISKSPVVLITRFIGSLKWLKRLRTLGASVLFLLEVHSFFFRRPEVTDELADVLGLVVAQLKREGVRPAADLANVLQVAQGGAAAPMARRDVILQMIFLERGKLPKFELHLQSLQSRNVEE